MLVVRCAVLTLMAFAAAVAGPSAPPAVAALPDPIVVGPVNGEVATDWRPVLRWRNPTGATQYQVQLVPFQGDGPGADLQFGAIASSFTVPPPPEWYGLLPDMAYTWRVRVSDAAGFAGPDDPSWTGWVGGSFRTPKVTSETITALTPADGGTAGTLTPVLQWANSVPQVFYYEFELASDPGFVARVAQARLHGGVASPVNGYRVSAGGPLRSTVTYYWHVRPRVQGDGAELPWSKTFSFRVDPQVGNGIGVNPPRFGPAPLAACGQSAGAAVLPSTLSLRAVGFSYSYTGSGAVAHNWYRDGQPLRSEAFTLAEGSTCATGTFAQPDNRPITPGVYGLEVWLGGQRVQNGEFTVTPATALALGPVTAGTGANGECGVTGAATAFPFTQHTLHFQWTSVGSGSYTATLYKGIDVVAQQQLSADGPVGCQRWSFDQFDTGNWRFTLTLNGLTVQSLPVNIF